MVCKCTLQSCCLVSAIVTALLGALLFGGSWLVQWGLTTDLRDTIIKGIVIDSEDSPGFDSWVINYGKGAAPIYQYFYFYNLTNLEAVKYGALPIFNQTGPYAYRQYKSRFNISFSDDGNIISYYIWERFEFLPENSSGSQDDVIINMNPAYLGVMAKAGSEWELLIGLTGPSIRVIVFDFLTGVFTRDLLSSTAADVIADLKTQLQASFQINDNQFFSYWANATSLPFNSSTWSSMCVSLNSNSSNISQYSASLLFDPNVPNSLLDRNQNATQAWRQILDGTASGSLYQQFQSQFNLSSSQLQSILSWKNVTLYPQKVVANLTSLWNVNNLNDIAYLQWGQGLITGGISVQELYPEMKFGMPPELALWWKAEGNPFLVLNADVSKQFLNGTYGIFSLPNVATFFAAVQNESLEEIYANWGLTSTQLGMVTPYLAEAAASFASQLAEQIFSEGGGLYTQRSVFEWLYYVQDPLVSVALNDPSVANAALVGNATSEEDARKAVPGPDICYTGKRDVNQIGDFIEWRGLGTISGVYNFELNVTGTNSRGQFQPFLSIDTVLIDFDDNYVRPLVLVPKGLVSHSGVSMIRYLIANETWGIDPAYFQSISGFCNLSGFHNGSNIFLSNPHMYGANQSYVDKIVGMKSWQNFTTDVTVIDIEPNSGAVMYYAEGLQVNLYVGPGDSVFNIFNGFIAKDIFYPILWVNEFGAATDKDFSLVKKDLYFGIQMRIILFWVIFSIGFVLLFSALIFGFIVWNSKVTVVSQQDYSSIQG